MFKLQFFLLTLSLLLSHLRGGECDHLKNSQVKILVGGYWRAFINKFLGLFSPHDFLPSSSCMGTLLNSRLVLAPASCFINYLDSPTVHTIVHYSEGFRHVTYIEQALVHPHYMSSKGLNYSKSPREYWNLAYMILEPEVKIVDVAFPQIDYTRYEPETWPSFEKKRIFKIFIIQNNTVQEYEYEQEVCHRQPGKANKQLACHYLMVVKSVSGKDHLNATEAGVPLFHDGNIVGLYSRTDDGEHRFVRLSEQKQFLQQEINYQPYEDQLTLGEYTEFQLYILVAIVIFSIVSLGILLIYTSKFC